VAAAITNVVGFDDAPFAREHRGDVMLIGAVCSRTRLDGVLTGRVRRDGANATRRMLELVHDSQFHGHVRAVLLQGIAVAGFNVIDIHGLARELGVPVVVVARRPPNLPAIRRALMNCPGWRRKWRLIERAGPMEPCAGIYIQRAGIERAGAEALIRATILHGKLPEPLRVAHLIAGGITTGVSRGRA
jgi:uncharacterized protein